MDEQEKLERAMKSWDCTKCKFRTDHAINGRYVTNHGPSCEIGFTQNPRTVEATRNLVKNGGTICFRHPMKYA